MTDPVLSLISLAKKSHHLVSGEFQTMEALMSMEAKLVIVSEDASENTKKKFSDKTKYRNVPMVCFETKENLGHAIGQKERAVIGITDRGFSESIRKKLENRG